MRRIFATLALCLCGFAAHAQYQSAFNAGTDVVVSVSTTGTIVWVANNEIYLALDNVGSNTILWSFGPQILKAPLALTGQLTITNANNLMNQTFTLNGSTRTWTTNASPTISQILIATNISGVQAATNLYANATNNTFGAGITYSQATNSVIFTALPGAALSFSNDYIGWGSLSISTNAGQTFTNAAASIASGSSKVFDRFAFPTTGQAQITAITTNGSNGNLLLEKGY